MDDPLQGVAADQPVDDGAFLFQATVRLVERHDFVILECVVREGAYRTLAMPRIVYHARGIAYS